MNKVRRFLSDTADKLDLPADILANIPKMEVTGFREFSIDAHQGLLEYETHCIRIDTDLGRIALNGKGLTIKLMNRSRITIRGDLYTIELQEAHYA